MLTFQVYVVKILTAVIALIAYWSAYTLAFKVGHIPASLICLLVGLGFSYFTYLDVIKEIEKRKAL